MLKTAVALVCTIILNLSAADKLPGGINGKPDFNKAVFYSEKAASQKHIQTLFLPGEIYEKGLNGKVDKDLAIKYCKEVAKIHPFWDEQFESNERETKEMSKNK